MRRPRLDSDLRTSQARQKVLEQFFVGWLPAGQLVDALRCADVPHSSGVPAATPQPTRLAA